MKLSRRSFMKSVPVAAAVVAAKPVQAAQKIRYGMVVDLRKCIGCFACAVACKAEQGVPLGYFKSFVIQKEYGSYPHVKRNLLPVLCNNCTDPACIQVCPVDEHGKYPGTKATWQRPDGIVVQEEDECIGCGNCVYGCPFGAKYLDPVTETAQKCDFCLHRVDQGLLPACVNACNTCARIFGDLNDPNSEISKVVAQNKVKPLMPFMGTKPNVFYIDLNTEGYLPLGQVVAGLKGQFHY